MHNSNLVSNNFFMYFSGLFIYSFEFTTKMIKLNNIINLLTRITHDTIRDKYKMFTQVIKILSKYLEVQVFICCCCFGSLVAPETINSLPNPAAKSRNPGQQFRIIFGFLQRLVSFLQFYNTTISSSLCFLT